MTLPATLYIAIGDFSGELGNLCDPGSFDDACDAYADAMAKDTCSSATVFRMDMPKGDQAGMLVDVTDDAKERIRCRMSLRDPMADAPEWLEAV